MVRKLMGVVVGLAVGLAFYGYAISGGQGPETITLPNKKGTVTFHHRKHQTELNIPCGECHHGPGHSPYKEGMEIKKCDTCHNKNFPNKKLNKPMKAFHKNCKGCHKQMAAKHPNAPTKCNGCHKK